MNKLLRVPQQRCARPNCRMPVEVLSRPLGKNSEFEELEIPVDETGEVVCWSHYRAEAQKEARLMDIKKKLRGSPSEKSCPQCGQPWDGQRIYRGAPSPVRCLTCCQTIPLR